MICHYWAAKQWARKVEVTPSTLHYSNLVGFSFVSYLLPQSPCSTVQIINTSLTWTALPDTRILCVSFPTPPSNEQFWHCPPGDSISPVVLRLTSSTSDPYHWVLSPVLQTSGLFRFPRPLPRVQLMCQRCSPGSEMLQVVTWRWHGSG